MCLATIGVAAAAASSVYGGITAAENASYQGQVAKNNAIAARQNAAYSASAAAANTESAGLKAAQKLGAVTAAQAANNLDVNTGSAADVSTSQRELGQLDVANEATKGALQVYGYQTQSANFEAQSKAYRAQEVPDIVGGILSGVGKVGSNAGQLGLGGGGDAAAADTSSIAGGGSLISSAPSVPSSFQWMRTDGGFADWDL